MRISSATPASTSIGQRVAEERTRLKLSQADLANALGISRSSVTFYETGRHQPGAEVLAGLHRLGADVVFILTGERPVVPDHAVVDMDRLALSMEEARRQLGLSSERYAQRGILDRAWVIYLALERYMASEHTPSK